MNAVIANPWSALPEISPFVLPNDRAAIASFNAKLPSGHQHRLVVDDVIPEPFAGAVLTCPVLVLQLNPGLDAVEDPAWHLDPDFRASLKANLGHEPTEWPLYFFDPRFRNHPGAEWWFRKTKQLATLAWRVGVVEWFPYKSIRFRPGCQVPSQEYSFYLVEKAMDRGALIVVSRSMALWEKSVGGLRNYPHKITLSSRQNVCLTPNNLKLDGKKTLKAWDLLVGALRAPAKSPSQRR